MAEIKLIDWNEFWKGARRSTVIEDVQRDFYLRNWAEGQELGVGEDFLLKQGYTQAEIDEAKRTYTPRIPDRVRRGQDWSFLADKPL